MRSIASRTLTLFSLLFLAAGLLACGGGGGSSPSAGSGTLNLSLTDASTNQYQAIYVTIAEVQVHEGGVSNGAAGWQTVMTPNKTYNLLDLVNGTLASLGTTGLTAGSYDQLRLILGSSPDSSLNLLGTPHPYANYFIDNQNNETELKVPSGLQSGIKIVGGFDIAAAQATDLVLDFDAARSVVRAGTSGKWLLKPTIKILETVDNYITGQVNDGTDPLAGSLVSAQVYPPGSLADANGVFVQSATLTDANGMYLAYVPPRTYNVVAVEDGFEPGCATVDANQFGEHVQNFTLVPATDSGTASGTVTGLTGTDASATIDVLQTMECGNGEVPVQVDSTNVADGGNYAFKLPSGDYTLVATSTGQATQVFPITVPGDQKTITQDIDFSNP